MIRGWNTDKWSQGWDTHMDFQESHVIQALAIGHFIWGFQHYCPGLYGCHWFTHLGPPLFWKQPKTGATTWYIDAKCSQHELKASSSGCQHLGEVIREEQGPLRAILHTPGITAQTSIYGRACKNRAFHSWNNLVACTLANMQIFHETIVNELEYY